MKLATPEQIQRLIDNNVRLQAADELGTNLYWAWLQAVKQYLESRRARGAKQR